VLDSADDPDTKPPPPPSAPAPPSAPGSPAAPAASGANDAAADDPLRPFIDDVNGPSRPENICGAWVAIDGND
jgi:hypothetical protein